MVLEKQVVCYLNIKQHVGQPFHQRPVIKLGICLKDTYKEIDVDLMNRSGFNYTILLGRNFLADEFVVDAARQFIQKLRCKIPH